MLRREFLGKLGASAGLAFLPPLNRSLCPADPEPDATLHIAPVELEVAPKKIVKTIGYNGTVPGPHLRFREGQRVTIEAITRATTIIRCICTGTPSN